MTEPSAKFPIRKAYRRAEVREIYGASLHSIDRATREGLIRTRHFGRCVFLHARDVDRVFGFEEASEISMETLVELGDLLS
jgi:hypothetical protein